MTSFRMKHIMATPTTLNIGEPADERSVDGNNAPCGEYSHTGDREPPREGKNEGLEYTSNPFSPRRSQIDMENLLMRDMGYDEEDEENGRGEFMRLFPEFLITPSDFGFKIAPSVGSVCYGYFSLACMNPFWFNRAFGDVHEVVKNILWAQAHLGIGLYVYSRRHIRKLPVSRAVLYSLFGSVLFNFGSCMVWGLGKTLLPHSPALRVAFSLLSSCLLLYAGQDYLQYVDDSCSELD